MVHGDDKGLKIPPKIAPIQVVIIPINPKKEKSEEFSNFVTNVEGKLSHVNIRTHIDNLDESMLMGLGSLTLGAVVKVLSD